MNELKYILSYLTPGIRNIISNIDKKEICNLQEIRLRADRPVIIVVRGECLFLNRTGSLSTIYSSRCATVSKGEITEIFNKMCDYSLHSHYEDVLNGYVTLKNGARVGLTGTAVYDKNQLKGIRCIDGLNIRIPRNVRNFSSVIFREIFTDKVDNLLIAGPPSSGKTTMLKDLVYQLSVGNAGRLYKICVIDERKEIICAERNVDNTGYNTDVLHGFSKAEGISIAVRCLSPHIIISDEIGYDDADSIIGALNSGVKFIFTIHAENYAELQQKQVYKKLVENQCIRQILFINSFNNFTIIKDDKVKETTYENAFIPDSYLSDGCFHNEQYK